ncbi:JmjC domain-containing histone demethylation protein [Colletotrichum camelliae]|nr:JmjC domain-containing histone demethylation protein [Colletotrichum camelliae]
MMNNSKGELLLRLSLLPDVVPKLWAAFSQDIPTCRLADLGGSTSDTLAILCRDQAVTLKGFAKVKVVDYHGPNDNFITIVPKANGNMVFHYSATYSPVNQDGSIQILFNAKAFRQSIKVQLHNDYSVDENTVFSSTSEKPSSACDYYLGDWESVQDSNQLHTYLTCGPHLEHLLEPKRHYPGITTPYFYLAKDGGTCTPMHIEDAGLPSVNMVRWGSPKVWLIIEPGSSRRFEELVASKATSRKTSGHRQALYGRNTCSQFIRHSNILFSRETLNDWGIKYSIAVCKPGELIVTLPYTYHQVVNLGTNLAESTNVLWSGIDLELTKYSFCSKRRCGNRDLSITGTDFAVPTTGDQNELSGHDEHATAGTSPIPIDAE